VNVLSIQSAVSYGHVGNGAAAFLLQRLGHDVWPVNTVAFSNHPAHGGHRGQVVPAPELAELVAGLAERGFLAACDAVLSGYLGEAATASVVLDAVRAVRAANPRARYCCDPVMGETGRGVYVQPGIPEALADRLVPAADVITPNAFELEWLTGIAPATVDAALAAADAARRLGPAVVVATGLRFPGDEGAVATLAVGDGGAWLARAPHRAVPTHGAGDAFTAVFLGVWLRGESVPVALAHAVAAVDEILAATESHGGTELCLVRAQDRIRAPGSVPAAERLRWS
jgi:pyridoxine kinase